MKQQREVEEQTGVLQDDLRHTKEAMDGRLQATEESLEGIHRELTVSKEAQDAEPGAVVLLMHLKELYE